MLKPFKGAFFYEWQIGCLVIQVRHTQTQDRRFRRLNIWRDPHYKD